VFRILICEYPLRKHPAYLLTPPLYATRPRTQHPTLEGWAEARHICNVNYLLPAAVVYSAPFTFRNASRASASSTVTPWFVIGV